MNYSKNVDVEGDYLELYDRCKVRFSNFDADLLRLAFNYCVTAHVGRYRKNGISFYKHPLAVAYILLDEIPLDMTAIMAALLHNVLDESNVYTYEDIKFAFGSEIADIVNKVSRIKYIESQHIDRVDQLDNYRGLLISLTTDIRIILVKLADRLDNMRTLDFVSSISKLKFSRETLDIYAPFANRFGLTRIKFELEDLSFKYLYPDIYKEIESSIKGTHLSRTEYIDKFKLPIIDRLELEGLLKKEGVKYRINGRAKNIYSIYNKTLTRGKSVNELYDIFAVRIILETENPLFCYYVYGIVGELYKPIPDSFKDYVASPKANGYRSLHTAVAGPEDKIVEVQIRTEQMHKASEIGVAAHFKYKSGVDSSSIMDDIQIQSWLAEVRDIFDKVGEENSNKLLSLTLQTRLVNKIYVFTPNNEFKELPAGATVLDFAFEIHTDLGLSCLGAKVNGKFSSVNYILNSGDKVEVLISTKQTPEKIWLDFVVTTKATTKLIDFFKKEKNIALNKGKQLWISKNIEHNIKNIDSEKFISAIKRYNFSNENEFYVSIGNDSLNLDAIYSRIITDIENQTEPNQINNAQTLKNIYSYQNNNFTFSECCNPLPGDSIFGIQKKHRHIEVHNSNCEKYIKLLNTYPKDLIILDWEYFIDKELYAKLHIIAEDKIEIMEKIINIIRCNDINQIISINYESNNSEFYTTIKFKISNNSFINAIITDIEYITGIKTVKRTG